MKLTGKVFAVLLALACASRAAEKADAKGEEFYAAKIKPILSDACYECHSHQAKKIKGSLVLDTREGALKGGESEKPSIVPGKPEESLLIRAVTFEDEDLQMPPEKGDRKRLSKEQVALLREWIKMGAPYTSGGGAAGLSATKRIPGLITDADRKWWSFQPVHISGPPIVNDGGWWRNEIDRFILSEMARSGIPPSNEAEPRVLIRRVYFDLIGLPPSPSDVEEFVRACEENQDSKTRTVHSPAVDAAYEKLVDRLLASPRYGERWARHWLDLVRYADSDGYRIDDYRPNAWRYRDYVIKSFNDDKPYDRFVKEQIAGDELFPGDPDAVIATGFLRHWIYEYNNRDVVGQLGTILNDITDTTSDVFMGMGLQCARCHDHKFDPILQKDYFRLQAFFAALLPGEDLVAATAKQKADFAKKSAAWEKKTAALRAELAKLEHDYRTNAAHKAVIMFPPETQAMINKPVAERTPQEHQLAELAYRQVTYEYGRLDKNFKGESKEKILALRKQIAAFDAEKPEPLPLALAMTDLGPVAPPIMIPKKGKEPIEPGYLTILDPNPAKILPVPGVTNTTGRRATLANWLTDPKNPLASRVIANRIWQYHFSRGLAPVSSDFGHLGETPSHPELLDWLATRFVADGWSFKKMHRLILLSATYRQSAVPANRELALKKDPENRLLGRGFTRRLDSEQIRDAVFAITGELDLKEGGSGVHPGLPRRSIYTKVMRNYRDPFLEVFDTPFFFSSASSRDTTTTPVQSLMLVNSQFMLKRAEALSKRIASEGSPSKSVAAAYELAFGRAPSADETTAALNFIAEQEARIDVKKASSAEAAFLHDKIPQRDGQAAVLKPDGPQNMFVVDDSPAMPKGDFTIEAFVLARSIYDSGTVRIIADKWTGSMTQPGWGFGITGKASRRKPQTLVLQMIGKKLDGSIGEAAIFSDQHIQMNKPYYVSCSFKLARDGQPGVATFYVKDLSNDDEPLMKAEVPHSIVGGFENDQPLMIGGRTPSSAYFDGLIDEVRLSNTALDERQILFTNESLNKNTVGYWQFENSTGIFSDSSVNKLNIRAAAATANTTDKRKAALTDFCHALLNANEFLYVE